MMRRHRVLVVTASLAAAMSTGVLMAPRATGAAVVPAAKPVVLAASSWHQAIEVPGLARLGRSSEVSSVSCGSAGSCVAAGSYRGRQHREGFLAVERHGRWGDATEVPGRGTLNKGSAEVSEVSCPSAGNCVAGGSYTGRGGHGQGFVIVERNGGWGKAIEVPGLGALNKGGAGVDSVSCVSAGNCTAVGLYTDGGGLLQMFAVSQHQGRWRSATEVPGLGTLNTGSNEGEGMADVAQLSCASPGDCAAGGFYTDHAGNQQGYLVSERNGRWGTVIEVPGLGALNKGENAQVNSMSCGAAGSCLAGGTYTSRGDNGEGFVAVSRKGHWGDAIKVPGLAKLNSGSAEVDSVSCPSAGNCAVVGTDSEPYSAGFVASEKNGIWGKARDLGLGGRIAGANSVACASAGNCAAAGFYSNSSGSTSQGWVAVERRGRWGGGISIPGLVALNKGGYALVYSMSCPAAGSCAAGGFYTGRHDDLGGFVVSQGG